MTRNARRALAALLALAALAACGGEGDATLRQTSPGSPRPDGGLGDAGGSSGGSSGGAAGKGGSGAAGTGGAGVPGGASGTGGAGAAGGGAGGQDPGPTIRTVSTRGIFGNVAASDNMLWDGDFEWSGAFITQYGWASATIGWNTSVVPDIEVGATCRSGLKCARVKKGGGIVGVAVSPSTPTTLLRAWAKVPEGTPCSKVRVSLAGCFAYVGATGTPLDPATPDPDEGGWCKLEGERPTLDVSPCVFVVNKSINVKEPIFVDDVYLGPPASTGAAGSAGSAPAPALPATKAPAVGPSAEDRADIEALQGMMRGWRDRPPPARQRPPAVFPVVRRARAAPLAGGPLPGGNSCVELRRPGSAGVFPHDNTPGGRGGYLAGWAG
jgi:hypothetical protein